VLKFGVLPHFWLYQARVLPHITAVLPQQEIVAKRDKKETVRSNNGVCVF
jgi:hypothetical protein